MAPNQTKSAPTRSRVEINLNALRHNARLCREEAGCPIMAIVKADGYGHGLEEIVRELDGHVEAFGVANLQEASRISTAIPALSVQVLILSPATPGEIPAIIESGFAASVSTPEEVGAFNNAAKRTGRNAILHAVADTGMGRMGSSPDLFVALVNHIKESDHCLLAGVDTHFPSADEDSDFTTQQIAVFSSLLNQLDLPDTCEVHLANSAGILGFKDQMPFATMARPGLALYGISPLRGSGEALQPILEWKTLVTLVRDINAGTSISYGRTFVAGQPMRVATLGIGYGDGYPRHLSGADASVLIAGQRCPILGRVTMDQVVVDITHIDEPVASGDEAVVLGVQGNECIPATELAEKAGTIPWEILTGITSRVERVYL